jgi:hypothetical protein
MGKGGLAVRCRKRGDLRFGFHGLVPETDSTKKKIIVSDSTSKTSGMNDNDR